MKTYLAKELAGLAGVTVRTLHHYHAIGLLKPAKTDANGYRVYGRGELERLQAILVYRALGLSLGDIGRILDAPSSSRRAILVAQREQLVGEIERFTDLIATIDRTITDHDGAEKMKDKDLYKGLGPKKQAEYENWLMARGGGKMALAVEKASKAQDALGKKGQAAAMQELRDIEHALATEMANGKQSDDPALEPLLESFRVWVGNMWGRDCSRQDFGGLADLHLAHPDFVTRYETIAPGFSVWHADAMKAHAVRTRAA